MTVDTHFPTSPEVLAVYPDGSLSAGTDAYPAHCWVQPVVPSVNMVVPFW